MMSAKYVVADVELNAFLGAHDTEEQALDYVRRLLATNGEDYANELAVGRQTADGAFVGVTTGPALLERVKNLSRRRELVAAGDGTYGGGHSESFGAMAAKGYGK